MSVLVSVKRGDAVIVGLATPGLLALALLAVAAVLLLGCACCARRKGFTVSTFYSKILPAYKPEFPTFFVPNQSIA